MPLRIGIVGPESTGKSTLAAGLAQQYQAPWVPEYARAYLSQKSQPYEEADLLAIAQGQLQAEEEACSPTTRLLFCDTTLLVIKIWSEQKYGRTHPWIDAQWHKRHYDHYLLTAIDVPWAPDPLRENPKAADRAFLFSLYEAYLQKQPCPYVCLRGSPSTRMKKAVAYLDKFLSPPLQKS